MPVERRQIFELAAADVALDGLFSVRPLRAISRDGLRERGLGSGRDSASSRRLRTTRRTHTARTQGRSARPSASCDSRHPTHDSPAGRPSPAVLHASCTTGTPLLARFKQLRPLAAGGARSAGQPAAAARRRTSLMVINKRKKSRRLPPRSRRAEGDKERVAVTLTARGAQETLATLTTRRRLSRGVNKRHSGDQRATTWRFPTLPDPFPALSAVKGAP